jgi:hypothetical protein
MWRPQLTSMVSASPADSSGSCYRRIVGRWIVLVLATACGGSTAGGGSASSSSTGQAEHDSTSGAASTDATLDQSESATSSSYDTGGFIPTPDLGGPLCGSDELLTAFPCSVIHQDCPDGRKCSPRWWEHDGRVVPNDAACVPIAERPKILGEACAIDGAAGSPCDDCDGSTRCWPDDQGHSCVAFCSGSRPDFTCPEDTACALMWNAYFPLCLPRCDPLVPTCGEGFGCVLTSLQEFVCFPALIDEPGALDQLCMFERPCAEGLTCIPASALANACASDFGCCRPWCNVADPSCARGDSCVPYFDDPPPGHANLGVCRP